MMEVFLDNSDGTVWDLSSLVTEVSWSTYRLGKAGSVDLSFIWHSPFQSRDFTYGNGDVLRIKYQDKTIFYGYVFSVDSGPGEVVQLTAYDQMRYLMNTDTYVFENTTASEMLRQIAEDFKLKLGNVEDTKYVIPSMVEDGQKLMDIIYKAITKTFVATGNDYCLYDDAGSLCLRSVEREAADAMVSDALNLVDYQVQKSIDDDTFNQIKLYRDNEETGKRELYVAKDSSTIAKWGMLQHYESVDSNMNEAQISELLDNLIKVKNRETKSLQVTALGNIDLRAGMRVHIVIDAYQVRQSLLIDECTHAFAGADHTMKLNLRVI